MVNDLAVVSGSIIITVVVVVVIVLLIIFIPSNTTTTNQANNITPTQSPPITTQNIKIPANKKVTIPKAPELVVESVIDKPPVSCQTTIPIKVEESPKPIPPAQPIPSLVEEEKPTLNKEPILEEYDAASYKMVIDIVPDQNDEVPNLVQPSIKPVNEDYSHWSETDSWGKRSFRDKPFDLSESGAYYVMANNIIDEPGIIDIVEYNKELHYLYNNNTIRVGNKKYRLHARETKSLFETIVVHGKYLLALADGALYYLYKQRANRWSFRPVDLTHFNEIVNVIAPIIRISSGPYLVIQTERYLYLYNEEGVMIERILYLNTHKRVYGKTSDVYVDIDLVSNMAKLSTSRIRYTNVIDAIISNEGNLIPITTERYKETNYIGIRQINGEIYFLKG